jgi:hypothetical protein
MHAIKSSMVTGLFGAGLLLATASARAHVGPRAEPPASSARSMEVAPPPGIISACWWCWLSSDQGKPSEPAPDEEGDQDCTPDTGEGCVCTQDYHCFDPRDPTLLLL